MSFHSPIKNPERHHVSDETRAVHCDLPDTVNLLPGEVELIEMYLGNLEEIFSDSRDDPASVRDETEKRKRK